MKCLFLIIAVVLAAANAARAGVPLAAPEQRVLSSYRLEAGEKYSEAVDALMPVYLAAEAEYFPNLRLGWLFYRQGIYSNSLKHYKAALKAEPEAIAPRQGLISIYIVEGKWEKVAAEAENILKPYPGHLQTQQTLVRSLLEQKNWAAALDKVNAYLKTEPLDLTLLEQKARVLRELKREDLLEAHLKKLLLVYPLDEYARGLKSAR